jgi:LacI family transcriptional regulator
MRTQARPSIEEIARLSRVSKATVDRVLHGRAGVHPRTRDKVDQALVRLEEAYQNLSLQALGSASTSAFQGPQQFGFIIQSGQAFTDSLLAAVEGQQNRNRERALQLECHRADSDQAVLETIKRLSEGVDGLAIICKNIAPILNELKCLRQAGKPVLAVVSDLEPEARSAYLGIDNRAAGKVAAYLMGRHLEERADAQVAVVVGSFSYRCHEDREIGFRSLMRQLFAGVEVLEVIKGEDSSEATYDAARKLLEARPNIAGVYNVAGGNRGLTRALSEFDRARRPIYITHELNQVTEPLLRAQQIDYLITQDLDELVRRTLQLLQEATGKDRELRDLNPLPIRLLTQFNIP